MGVTSPLDCFLASQVTVPRSSRKPPAWASTCWATARSESTLAAVEAPCVATTSYTPLAVCVRSAATRSSTSVRASSAKALLCQALTPPTVMPVAATHAVANATTLVLMSQRKGPLPSVPGGPVSARSEEHTSELQSRQYLVCRLLLDKKNHHRTSQLP